MDHKILKGGFMPPAPMRIEAYLDDVTKGQLKNLEWLNLSQLDAALDLIEARPTLAERAALLSALDDRFVTFGRSQGFMAPVEAKTDEERAGVMTQYIVEDVLGLKQEPVRTKIQDEFKSLIVELVKGGLNSKGKASLQVLSTLHELAEARSATDVARALANASLEKVQRWIAIPANSTWLMKSALKIGRVSPVARNRLAKLIATRLVWAEVTLARLAWVTPWLLFLDLLFTPEMTATDEVERRLGFLALYGRIFTRQSSVWSRLVEACEGTEWRFKMPPATALGATIQRMH